MNQVTILEAQIDQLKSQLKTVEGKARCTLETSLAQLHQELAALRVEAPQAEDVQEGGKAAAPDQLLPDGIFRAIGTIVGIYRQQSRQIELEGVRYPLKSERVTHKLSRLDGQRVAMRVHPNWDSQRNCLCWRVLNIRPQEGPVDRGFRLNGVATAQSLTILRNVGSYGANRWTVLPVQWVVGMQVEEGYFAEVLAHFDPQQGIFVASTLVSQKQEWPPHKKPYGKKSAEGPVKRTPKVVLRGAD